MKKQQTQRQQKQEKGDDNRHPQQQHKSKAEMLNILDLCNIFYKKQKQKPRICYSSQIIYQLKGLFQSLNNKASFFLNCDVLCRSSSSSSTTDSGINMAYNQTEEANAIDQTLNIVSFLRALVQCSSISLDVCKYVAKTHRLNETMISAMQDHVLEPLRPFLWKIMASLEPYIFWHTHPFWTGLSRKYKDISNASILIWKVYVQLFLLACFDNVQILRKQKRFQLDQHQQHAAAGLIEPKTSNFEYQSKPIKTPVDIGFGSGFNDECDDKFIEKWPMSTLFSALDAMADEWTRTEYTGAMVRLVARCFLRYSVLAYAMSPASIGGGDDDDDGENRISSVHDMPLYCIKMDRGIGVKADTYYGEGGAILRDMLSDMYVISRLDAILSGLSLGTQYTTILSSKNMFRCSLSARLWLSLSGTGQDVLMQLCNNQGIVQRVSCGLEDNTNKFYKNLRVFFENPKSKPAETCFVKTGLYELIQPGEIWRFAKAWPTYNITALNIINGLRERDMVLYKDKVMLVNASDLILTPNTSLPGALIVLMDHLVLEGARHMMRIYFVKDAVEGFTNFLLEKHHLKYLSNTKTPWDKFFIWSALLTPPPGSGSGSGPPLTAEEELKINIYKNVAILAVKTQTLPPFPHIILGAGRKFLWNPFFPGQVVMDISDLPVASILNYWLAGRLKFIEILLEQKVMQEESLIKRLAMARAKVYKNLLCKWFKIDDDLDLDLDLDDNLNNNNIFFNMKKPPSSSSS